MARHRIRVIQIVVILQIPGDAATAFEPYGNVAVAFNVLDLSSRAGRDTLFSPRCRELDAVANGEWALLGFKNAQARMPRRIKRHETLSRIVYELRGENVFVSIDFDD